MRKLNLLPQRLLGRLLLWVLLAVFLGQVISFWILADERRQRLHEAGQELLMQRLVTIWELVEELPASSHGNLLEAMAAPGQKFTLTQEPVVLPGQSATGWELALRQALPQPVPPSGFQLVYPDHPRCERDQDEYRREEEEHRWEKEEYDHHERHRRRFCLPRLKASLQTPSGPWLNLELVAPPQGPPWSSRVWLSLVVTAVLVALAVIISVGRLIQPLKKLSEAARSFARGQPRPIKPSGPRDLQEVIQAFNSMQEQVGQQLEERARLLAALSHDLRTPITHMRLRVELLPDGQDRDKLLASLEAMQQLSETTLDFVRGSNHEAKKPVDIQALLQSLCDDYADQGQAVDYRGGPGLIIPIRTQALRRALQNLIDNALKYGQRAKVMLEVDKLEVKITITDEGPGIPEKEREKVFQPFYRLEASRSETTGGSGLGLAIARSLIQQQGGQLTLDSRPDGNTGLVASIQLPRKPDQS
ncbi:ATP-binding protein [Marinospirillum perlucidum]|uniref:ATP-binding protein n=1 Tax=Marinospirillum perlucidum TaxID=1982602 RepID=UPI000DF2F954|nr:ATP-binding protein [Marinospirillum perlucidum]